MGVGAAELLEHLAHGRGRNVDLARAEGRGRGLLAEAGVVVVARERGRGRESRGGGVDGRKRRAGGVLVGKRISELSAGAESESRRAEAVPDAGS